MGPKSSEAGVQSQGVSEASIPQPSARPASSAPAPPRPRPAAGRQPLIDRPALHRPCPGRPRPRREVGRPARTSKPRGLHEAEKEGPPTWSPRPGTASMELPGSVRGCTACAPTVCSPGGASPPGTKLSLPERNNWWKSRRLCASEVLGASTRDAEVCGNVAAGWREIPPSLLSRLSPPRPLPRPDRPQYRGAESQRVAQRRPPHPPISQPHWRQPGGRGRRPGTAGPGASAEAPLSIPASVSQPRADKSTLETPGPAPRLGDSSSSNSALAASRAGSSDPAKAGAWGGGSRCGAGTEPGPLLLPSRRARAAAPSPPPPYLCPAAGPAPPPCLSE